MLTPIFVDFIIKSFNFGKLKCMFYSKFQNNNFVSLGRGTNMMLFFYTQYRDLLSVFQIRKHFHWNND